MSIFNGSHTLGRQFIHQNGMSLRIFQLLAQGLLIDGFQSSQPSSPSSSSVWEVMLWKSIVKVFSNLVLDVSTQVSRNADRRSILEIGLGQVDGQSSVELALTCTVANLLNLDRIPLALTCKSDPLYAHC